MKKVLPGGRPFFGVSRDRINFTHQLGRMLQAGLPVVQALQRMQLHVRSRAFRHVVVQLRLDIQAGHTLTEAMAHHPQVFDEFYLAAVEVGERSGKLELVLERLTNLYNERLAISRRIMFLMAYPVFALLAILVMAGVFLGFVVPVVIGSVAKSGIELPVGMQVLLFVRENWFWIGFAIFDVVAALAGFLWKNRFGRRLRDEAVLVIPFVSGLIHRIQASHFLNSFSLAYEAGLSMDIAVALAARTVSNDYLREVFEAVPAQLAAGEPLSLALADTDTMPGTVLEDIAIGEESGQLDNMLRDALAAMSKDINHRINVLITVMNLGTLLFLAGAMGGFLLLFYTSIFQIIGSAINNAFSKVPSLR